MVASGTASLRFTLFGVLFGLCFPVGSLVALVQLGAIAPDSPWRMVAAAHRTQPLLYVIDTAPLFLGFLAYLVGVREDGLRRFSERLEEEVQAKTEELRQALNEANEANELITHLADHDDLCQLLNRRCFTKVLASWLRYSNRYGHPGALLFLDLDNFKAINDAYGHDVGDGFLCRVAERLRGAVRDSDAVARWGGDEFVVFLPQADGWAAKQVANKLLDRLGSEPVQVGDHELEIRTSIGITLFPDLATEVDQLLEQGDRAMYEAKQAGGCCWCLFGEETAPASVGRHPG